MCLHSCTRAVCKFLPKVNYSCYRIGLSDHRANGAERSYITVVNMCFQLLTLNMKL